MTADATVTTSARIDTKTVVRTGGSAPRKTAERTMSVRQCVSGCVRACVRETADRGTAVTTRRTRGKGRMRETGRGRGRGLPAATDLRMTDTTGVTDPAAPETMTRTGIGMTTADETETGTGKRKESVTTTQSHGSARGMTSTATMRECDAATVTATRMIMIAAVTTARRGDARRPTRTTVAKTTEGSVAEGMKTTECAVSV
mmetsp:Transcript_19051/g.45944  ORF Transcript_19051/g.45944 Transcript_19051/m.45944 type:complete len:202 (-) Transcript_19051:371-976(-)